MTLVLISNSQFEFSLASCHLIFTFDSWV